MKVSQGGSWTQAGGVAQVGGNSTRLVMMIDESPPQAAFQSTIRKYLPPTHILKQEAKSNH